MTRGDYSGPEKAAIFLMSLGEKTAAKIFEFMDESETLTLNNHMSDLGDVGDVDAKTVEAIRKSFHEGVQNRPVASGAGEASKIDTLHEVSEPPNLPELGGYQTYTKNGQTADEE